ncbi:TetR/AcrR family transcriptional regulator [Candidatus Gracilibacteria bacterium]|nr:TetR/AcrR family transcriptional regulator [Candidatus Gracilibacteria bacterium]
MPTFSDNERIHIRAALINTAGRLFVQQGLKKTSLEELTAAVGIAKSSFYSFFTSKEELYLELLMLERPAAEASLLPLLAISGDTAAGIAAFCAPPSVISMLARSLSAGSPIPRRGNSGCGVSPPSISRPSFNTAFYRLCKQ